MQQRAGKRHEPLILVVDSSPEACVLASIYLKRHGFRVITSGTVTDALMAMRHHSPSAVVCDYHLKGGGDGLALLTGVGNWYKGVTRVLWTHDNRSCEYAKAHGMVCIPKKVHYSFLVKTLQDALGMSFQGP